MRLKALHTIGHKAYVEGAEDAHGNVVTAWAPEQPLRVYGIAPRGSNEPTESGRNAVVSGYSVLAPVAVIGPRDRLVIFGDTYEVQGEVQNWNTGPFGWTPGVEVLCERVEG